MEVLPKYDGATLGGRMMRAGVVCRQPMAVWGANMSNRFRQLAEQASVQPDPRPTEASGPVWVVGAVIGERQRHKGPAIAILQF